MKYNITAYEETGRIEVRTEGNADVHGFQSFLNDMFSHPKWKPGQSILIDHSDLILRFFQTEEVRTVSNMVIKNKEKIGKGKWAFVVRGSFAYGLARMWQIITEEKVPMEINIFKDRQKAIKWLSNGKVEG